MTPLEKREIKTKKKQKKLKKLIRELPLVSHCGEVSLTIHGTKPASLIPKVKNPQTREKTEIWQHLKIKEKELEEEGILIKKPKSKIPGYSDNILLINSDSVENIERTASSILKYDILDDRITIMLKIFSKPEHADKYGGIFLGYPIEHIPEKGMIFRWKLIDKNDTELTTYISFAYPTERVITNPTDIEFVEHYSKACLDIMKIKCVS